MTDVPRDRREQWPVTASATLLQRGFLGVRRDTLRGPDGQGFDRDLVEHDDAVGVLALDDDERVLLLGQYRHAVGHRLLELPAGLLDVPGEDPMRAVERELFEEAHLRARDWRVLVDVFASPGCSTEAWRVFLARDLSPVPAAERFVAEHEEADLDVWWLPLTDAVEAVLAGRISDAMAVVGLLACWAARGGDGYEALRGIDAPWTARV